MNMFALSDTDPGGRGVRCGYTGFGTLSPPKKTNKLRGILIQ